MKKITIKTPSAECIVHCGAGVFEKHIAEISSRQCFVVTDRNVFAYYRHLLWEKFGDDFKVYIMPAGEPGKSLTTLKAILQEMLNCGMKRCCTVVAFGGGAVGDVAGLAASLYMRGVKLVQIPTTLLAQADSCIGGKTAIDFGGIKNLVGTFYQPETVIADPRFLSTLSEREIRCGLGEMVKCASLSGEIFKIFSERRDFKDINFLEDMIFRCLTLKAGIVERDEEDLKGIRNTLNSGHTTGHSLEEFYGKKSHGEYVLIGLFYEAYISEKLGTGDKNYLKELKELIMKIIKVPPFSGIEKAAELAANDKKNCDGDITIIAPCSAGVCREIKLPLTEYAQLLKECSDGLGGVRRC